MLSQEVSCFADVKGLHISRRLPIVVTSRTMNSHYSTMDMFIVKWLLVLADTYSRSLNRTFLTAVMDVLIEAIAVDLSLSGVTITDVRTRPF